MKKFTFIFLASIIGLTFLFSCSTRQENIFFNKVEKTYYEKGVTNTKEIAKKITVRNGDTTWDLAETCGGNPKLWEKIRYMNPWLDKENRYFEKEVLVNGKNEVRPFIHIFKGEELFVPLEFSCDRITVIENNVQHQYYFPTEDELFRKLKPEENVSGIGNIDQDSKNESVWFLPFLLGWFLPILFLIILLILAALLIQQLLNQFRKKQQPVDVAVVSQTNITETVSRRQPLIDPASAAFMINELSEGIGNKGKGTATLTSDSFSVSLEKETDDSLNEGEIRKIVSEMLEGDYSQECIILIIEDEDFPTFNSKKELKEYVKKLKKNYKNK